MKKDTITSPSTESLLEAAKQLGDKRLPPVHQWNPAFCGDLDMRISRDGTWYYLGSKIERPELVRLFSTILKREGEKYFLVTPVEKVGITVDDAPFVAVNFEAAGAGEAQLLLFETNVGDKVIASQDHPIRVEKDPATGEPSPYIHIRANLEALIDRKSFYRLVDIGAHNGDFFGIWSKGSFFPMISSDELARE